MTKFVFVVERAGEIEKREEGQYPLLFSVREAQNYLVSRVEENDSTIRTVPYISLDTLASMHQRGVGVDELLKEFGSW